jgi:hypothetical protein
MDVQDGLILSTVHGQHTSTSSQPSVASDRDTSMAMRSVSALSNQCNTQFITIKDRQGHDVPILTNVRIGSMAASEKRRRNAVASAKFRLNKSQKIDDLQTELFETRELLRRVTAERDYLKSIVEQDNTILAVHHKGL